VPASANGPVGAPAVDGDDEDVGATWQEIINEDPLASETQLGMNRQKCATARQMGVSRWKCATARGARGYNT